MLEQAECPASAPNGTAEPTLASSSEYFSFSAATRFHASALFAATSTTSACSASFSACPGGNKA